MQKLIYSFIFIFGITTLSGRAGATVSARQSTCENLLSQALPAPVATPFDHRASEFEGLYLEILEDAGQLPALPSAKIAYASEILLKKKADFLNRAIGMVMQLKRQQSEGFKHRLGLTQIYNMISSLGVNPAMYGLAVAPDGQAIFAQPLPKAEAAPAVSEADVETKKPIGFLYAQGPDDSLPDHLHRTIGFGRGEIVADELPSRVTGRLRIKVVPEKNALLVLDAESELLYTVDARLLAASGGESESKRFILAFDQNEMEWFISFENLANPEGKIGFEVF